MSKYTNEENIQILIALLKEHNIKKIIASPGTTNISFVASVQNDDFFEVYSCVDERSASYLACGLSAETGEPVVITCTGATASRNYLPGLTEAYYRKLPVIAITATQHLGRVGQNIAQVIDRSVQIKDTVKKSYQLTSVHSNEDRWACNLYINDILLECKRDGGGPVHINMVTTYDNSFECEKLPKQRKIERITVIDEFPNLDTNKKIGIFIGNHSIFTQKLTKLVEEFCEKYNAVVICDHTSNYNGDYKVQGNLICNQFVGSDIRDVDVLIDLGTITGSYMSVKPKEVWRVNPDGEVRDSYGRLKFIFAMEEETFFEKINSQRSEKEQTTYYQKWEEKNNELREKLSTIELPFSNIWIAQNTIDKLPQNSKVHLGILNTLRSWNFFENKKSIKFFCNTGGFGIDGIMSTAIGASLGTDEMVYCFIGDLAFFYDLNSIGNRELKSNLRILMVNNGCGTEFHNYNHRAREVSDDNGLSIKYFAADGHFGNKSSTLVQNYAQNLGFDYIQANNKEEFLNNIENFVLGENDKPIIFEVFTNSEDESEALKIIDNLDRNIKSVVKNMIGTKNIKKIRQMLGK